MFQIRNYIKHKSYTNKYTKHQTPNTKHQTPNQMFALLYRGTEVFHMIQFAHITNRWLPLYLANTNDTTIDADDIKILHQYLENHVNDMWKKYL